MGQAAGHQTNTARRSLVVGCATGIGATRAAAVALARLLARDHAAEGILTGQVFAADGGELLL
jgi:hypothetical protein